MAWFRAGRRGDAGAIDHSSEAYPRVLSPTACITANASAVVAEVMFPGSPPALCSVAAKARLVDEDWHHTLPGWHLGMYMLFFFLTHSLPKSVRTPFRRGSESLPAKMYSARGSTRPCHSTHSLFS